MQTVDAASQTCSTLASQLHIRSPSQVEEDESDDDDENGAVAPKGRGPKGGRAADSSG